MKRKRHSTFPRAVKSTDLEVVYNKGYDLVLTTATNDQVINTTNIRDGDAVGALANMTLRDTDTKVKIKRTSRVKTKRRTVIEVMQLATDVRTPDEAFAAAPPPKSPLMKQ